MASGIASGNVYACVVDKLVEAFMCWKSKAMLTEQNLMFLPFTLSRVKETERKLKENWTNQPTKNPKEFFYALSQKIQFWIWLWK